MSDQSTPEVELLRTAYAAFNSRDIDAALATMVHDVVWPKAFKGGFARGHQEVREYWKGQWSEIDPKVEPTSFDQDAEGRVTVHVHQVVRDMAGVVVADGDVVHRFKIVSGLIHAMEVFSLEQLDEGA